MPKQIVKKAPDISAAPPEEGTVITEQVKVSYEYIEIPINEVLNGLGDLAKEYIEFSQQTAGIAKAAIEIQRDIAENLQRMVRGMAKFDGLSVVIQSHIDSEISKISGATIQETHIYIQPTTPYVPLPILPPARRKKQFPTTAIQIENEGFELDGQYISGITINSKAGKALTVFIRQDLMGYVDDKLLYEITGIPYGQYDLLAFVLRDMKEILAGNKIIFDLKRYRGAKKYQTLGVRKLLRYPKKKRKFVPKAQLN